MFQSLSIQKDLR